MLVSVAVSVSVSVSVSFWFLIPVCVYLFSLFICVIARANVFEHSIYGDGVVL